MKPIFEKLPLSENSSFVARMHRTPHFEVSWHQHEEYELILFTEGEGIAFVGNYIGSFNKGDVFFLGVNLPHTFKKSDPEQITSAIVIHFREDFWGKDYLLLPECREVKKMLQESALGFKINGMVKEQLSTVILALVSQKEYKRLLLLGECLDLLSSNDQYTLLSTQTLNTTAPRDKDRIDQIFKYAMQHFLDPIDVSTIAKKVGLTIPAFCTYFKTRTHKTYVTFVNEIRIGYACTLLDTTEKTVLEISFESGFGNVSHFNRMFNKVKQITPTNYRKRLKM